ncbi:MAG: proline racemase family protein [Desulfobacteraceae bacterium]
MKISRNAPFFSLNPEAEITTIDSHTAGEATRLIINGVGPVKGSTMAEKLEYFKADYDHVRLMLTREPRGHKGILAAMPTESTTDDGDFGLIYMDARRYPYLCGHATIGAVTTLAETKDLDLSNGENTVRIDTPSGRMNASAFVEQGKVQSVAINMVPSFVLDTEKQIDLPGFGPLKVDLVCVGGFFAMVSSRQTGIDLVPENSRKLTELGMAIIDAANDQLKVYHPLRPEVNTVDVAEFYDPKHHDRLEGKNVVVYGESHIDRSPCGTGTAAKLTLMHYKKEIGLNQIFTNYSPLGTSFQAQIKSLVKTGDIQGIEAEIKGSAHITGVHRFMVDTNDPFPRGFILS